VANKIIPYNPSLKPLARKLCKQGIVSEILLWKQLQDKAFGVEFHRQVPMQEYIVDFYCHELMLCIEIDGFTHQFEDVYRKDLEREQQIASYGVTFLRFDDKEVKQNMAGVVRCIEMKIEELRAVLPSSPQQNKNRK
jgi:very-short-patch-repair endonuclease